MLDGIPKIVNFSLFLDKELAMSSGDNVFGVI